MKTMSVLFVLLLVACVAFVGCNKPAPAPDSEDASELGTLDAQADPSGGPEGSDAKVKPASTGSDAKPAATMACCAAAKAAGKPCTVCAAKAATKPCCAAAKALGKPCAVCAAKAPAK